MGPLDRTIRQDGLLGTLAESSRLLIRAGRQGDMVEIYDAEDYGESDNHAFLDIAHLSVFPLIFFRSLQAGPSEASDTSSRSGVTEAQW